MTRGANVASAVAALMCVAASVVAAEVETGIALTAGAAASTDAKAHGDVESGGDADARVEADSPGLQITALDEIVVHGRRGLETLRQGMIQLEDEFYDRFNALNSNDLYDVHCAEEARTGSLVRHRFCRATFEARAMQAEGEGHWSAMEVTTREPPQPWVPPVPAIVAITFRRDAFREEMRTVTARHPELIDLLRRRAALYEKYEKLRRESFHLDSNED